MSKIKVTVGTANVGDFIYDIKSEPTFPGRSIMKHSVIRQEIWQVSKGPGKNDKVRVFNEEFTLNVAGSLANDNAGPTVNEERAINKWGVANNASIKEAKLDIEDAKKQIKEAQELLKQKEQDLELLTNLDKVIVAYAEEGTLNFDKESDNLIINVVKS